MALTREHRRDLLSIVAISAGAFLGLALLPLPLTGPAGRVVGAFLWKTLGIGAIVGPVWLVGFGVAGFRPSGAFEWARIGWLGAGLVFVIPYWVGLAVGVRTISSVPADYAAWTFRHQAVGILPAFVIVGVTGVVGTAGAVIVGILGLSALTIATVGWHPFRRLGLLDRLRRIRLIGGGRSGRARGRLLGGGALDFETIEEPEEREAPVPPARRKQSRRSGSTASPTGFETEEQAFITGETVRPFPIDRLDRPVRQREMEDEAELDRLGHVLLETLKTFKVDVTLGDHRSTGPVVTRFEVAPADGVKVGRIAALADDLALKMAARSIRIAPIPGRSFVGVEVPNPTARVVRLRELLSRPQWDPARGGLPIALGRNLEGEPVLADLTAMPHLLIAGATGSGKSVCINTIITSLIFRYTERELKLLMIDPKMVELTAYNALPHLIHPVVTNNRHAAKALKWAMYEMETRYTLFNVNGVRNLHEFNRKVKEKRSVMELVPAEEIDGEEPPPPPGQPRVRPYAGSTKPYVVVIVDELADLMMTVQGEVEKPLAILAQKARATGIHLVLATQRPSVNVITGLIKANFPSRIAFRVASKVDSRTILDQNGAEALLGNGDMLFLPPGRSEPVRVQGAYISTEETRRITGWYAGQGEGAAGVSSGRGVAAEDILAVVQAREARDEAASAGDPSAAGERDALFADAAEICLQQQQGSTSLLQRRLRIGYGRAARIIDQLCEAGILGPPDGSRAREVLIGPHQLDEYLS